MGYAGKNVKRSIDQSFVIPARSIGIPLRLGLVIGRVVGVHIRDDALTPDGKLDVVKIRPLARLGYFDYTSAESTSTMPPRGPHLAAREAGLEGRPRGSRTGD